MAIRSLILFLSVLTSSDLFAAACCGGGASLPTLITGDYKAQVVLAATNSAVTHDSNQKEIIKKRDGANQEVIEVLNLSMAYLITPFWQIGASIPLKMNTHRTQLREESSAGLSDPKIQIGYEILPEYGYSVWKPRGHLFIEQSFPVSSSTYDATKPLRSDSLGNGLANTAIGISLIKSYKSADFLFMGEVHQGHKRTYNLSGSQFEVDPSMGYSVMLGIGYSPNNGNLRMGTTLLYSREGKKDISGIIDSDALPITFLEAGLNISYMLNNWSLQGSYRDQTFLATARNTPLSKSIGVSLIRFFDL